jgi:hypothetical protein
MPDYPMGILCLQENLALLNGAIPNESKALWNISNSLIVLLDAVQATQKQLMQIEQKLPR